MFDSEGPQQKPMSAATRVDLIDKTAGEAFLHLATAADRFERYEHPHAERIAAIADEIGKSFHLARHDRVNCWYAGIMNGGMVEVIPMRFVARKFPWRQESCASLIRLPR